MYAADNEPTPTAWTSDGSPVESFYTASGQLERITQFWPEDNSVGFVIELDGRVAGLLQVETMKDGSATLAYHVASEERGRGIATAAVAALLPVARSALGVRELVAEIATDNTASRHVVERNGFRLLDTVVIDNVVMYRYARST
jgi:ribosomal-protein-alanine N-acetyltransferase